MGFKKLTNDFGDTKEICGFWARIDGETLTGKVTKLVDTVNVKYPFYLVELSENGGTITHEDKEHTGTKGELVAIMASVALKPLGEHMGQLVRVAATGVKAVTFKDERGRKKPVNMRTFDIEVEDDDDLP